MRYRRVCLEALGYQLPPEVLSSHEIEVRLQPLYQRLGLPEGRLEMMTGIGQRRIWPEQTRPSDMSIASAQLAVDAAQVDPQQIGALIHASVCRDHLEPATACRVHRALGLPSSCIVYDVSNACLGLMNGILQVANMIELGQIKAGLVVGTETSRQLLETTIRWLNEQQSLSRSDIKRAIASLTIGSGSCAILIVDECLTRSQSRLVAGTAEAQTEFHELCHSGEDEAMVEGTEPLMWTDAEQLLREGVATGAAAFRGFLQATGWRRTELDRIVCHQVGSAHQRLLLETLDLDSAIDYCTYAWLGNSGSVALPISLALACQQGHIRAGHRVGLFGIGSGINCLMLGCHWQQTPVSGTDLAETAHGAAVAG